jgi:hypothetical protein
MSGFDAGQVTFWVGSVAVLGWLAVWSDISGWRRRRAKKGKVHGLPWWLRAARFIVIASAAFALISLYVANRDMFQLI